MSKIEVVLASSSPRRRQLLDEAGIRFRVQAADADESLDDDLRADPARAARTVAERKAAMVVQTGHSRFSDAYNSCHRG